MPNRIKDIYALFAALTLLAVSFLSPDSLAASPAIADANDDKAWRFRVFLDDREIGYHDFFLAGQGEHRQMRSVARFEYRLLFVTLFEYKHENLETWNSGCLRSIRSRTDANGDRFTVDGRQDADGFRVSGREGDASISGCVMSFAYWNPAFLDQERLLNSQDGRLLDVRVSPPRPDELVVGGDTLPAYRYRLEAGDMRLDLWYSDKNEWLALESEVAGGRTLRYEPVVEDAS